MDSQFMKDNEKEMNILNAYINDKKTEKGALMSILHKTQDLFGYIPEPIQKSVAEALKIPVAKVYGVVTFYSYFSLEPKGKYIVNVCMGTACFVKGSAAISDRFKQKLGIDNGETTEDGSFTLEDVRCIGACGLAPVITVNGKVYGNVKAADVPNIIKEYGGVNHE